jgi:hypothetical protein
MSEEKNYSVRLGDLIEELQNIYYVFGDCPVSIPHALPNTVTPVQPTVIQLSDFHIKCMPYYEDNGYYYPIDKNQNPKLRHSRNNPENLQHINFIDDKSFCFVSFKPGKNIKEDNLYDDDICDVEQSPVST